MGFLSASKRWIFARGLPAAALGFLAVTLAGATAGGQLQRDPLRVERRDVTRWVSLSGELQAVEEVVVTAPRGGGVSSVPISYLAPEGTRVEPDDLLVQFDSDMLESQLREAEVQLENARLELARRKAEQEDRRQELLLTLARARKTRRVAEIYAALDPALMSRSDREKYRYDLEKAVLEENKAVQQMETFEESARSELEVDLVEQRRQALKVDALRQDIERLSVRAPNGGLVLYAENFQTGNKVQVGDELWAGWPVVQLPDLGAFKVAATCYDADYHLLRVGTRVRVTLDAVAGRVFEGTISSLSTVARPPLTRVLKSKVFEVEVVLAEADPERMRPGMTARIEVPVSYPDALVVPRGAVRLTPGGQTSVVVADQRTVPVEVVDATVHWAIVEGELADGAELLPAAPDPGWRDEAAWIEVRRTELAISASATGTVHAARAVQVTPPAIPFQSQFKIVALAPEGSTVEAGEPVVAFDGTEMRRRLREDEDNLEKNRRELEKLEATSELRMRQLEMELETAATDVERARTSHEQARRFEGMLEARKTSFELEFAEEHVAILQRRLEARRRQQQLQRQVLEEQRELHLTRRERHRRANEALTVRAPAEGGLVVYEMNHRNEKKFIGAQAYRREPILQLPDMSSLIVRAQIAETDASRLQIDQSVKVRLEAFPDAVLAGRVAGIGTLYRRPVYNRPARVLDFDVELEKPLDPRLRPGMAAKVEVTTRKLEHGVTVPVKALGRDGTGTWVLVRTDHGPERRPVEVGEIAGPVAVILSGLREGEQVARWIRPTTGGGPR